MKYNLKRYRSALILQIILAHIYAIHSAHLIPKDILRYRRSMANNKFIGSTKYGVDYYVRDSQMEDKPNLLSRETKSGNQPHTFNIDLSQLRQNTPILHSTTRHKSPANLLSIDISALSQNPDPSLPIATKQSKDKVNGKFIMAYDFDPRFDRLPVNNKANPIHTYTSKHDTKGKALLPLMNLPLKVMTAYHSNFANKKHNTDFKIDDGSSTNKENEQKYTANFILQLLYQLSSNFKKVSHT